MNCGSNMSLRIILLYTCIFAPVTESIDDVEEQNYYETLEIPPTCSASEIKSAYRKLAVQWHPDKNPNNVEEATTKFTKISEAYEVLSSPEQRRVYDKTANHKPEQNGHVFIPKDPFEIFAEVFANSDDPFEQLLGNLFTSVLHDVQHPSLTLMGNTHQRITETMETMESTMPSEGRNDLTVKNRRTDMPLHKIFHNRRRENQGKNIMSVHSFKVDQNGMMTETSTTQSISENGHIMKHIETKSLGEDGKMHTDMMDDIDEGEIVRGNFGGFGGNIIRSGGFDGLLSSLFGGMLDGGIHGTEGQANPSGNSGQPAIFWF